MRESVTYLVGVECSREALKTLPRPIVFTNGVFDILHRGHVQYLREASVLGRSLVVAVNSDVSARMLEKGADRPINAEADRALLVASLRFVAGVTVFSQITPLEVLSWMRPEIYVKGGDYSVDSLPETPLVRSWGGEVKIMPYIQGYSTSGIVRRIKA